MGSYFPPAVQGVHIVGSMPPDSSATATQVFGSLCASLPGRLKRVPDGELGERFYYVNWQLGKFTPAVRRRVHFMHKPEDLPALNAKYRPNMADVEPLGYDEAAVASYAEFKRAREAGAVPPGVRFQVSLPLPCEAVAVHVEPCFQKAIAPLYEQRMAEVVGNIRKAIPAHDLAIQWDLAVAVAFQEYASGRLSHPFFKPWDDDNDPLSYAISQAGRMLALTPVKEGVEVGFHLCYGDLEHRHFVEPQDTTLLVEMANLLRAEVKRQNGEQAEPGWFHMPVPKDRTDDSYFAPMKNLNLSPDTQLFLGLVHPGDLEGTKKRIEAAQKHCIHGFGVATECGMGRTPKDQLPGILEIAKEVSQPYET